jgi:hypothetical protein
VGVVAPAAAAPGIPGLIDVGAELVLFVVVNRKNRGIRADEIAHAASDAGEGGFRPLPDAVVNAEEIAGFFLQAQLHLDDALAMHAQVEGADRADGRAAPAEGALLLIPQDDPGEILCAQR